VLSTDPNPGDAPGWVRSSNGADWHVVVHHTHSPHLLPDKLAAVIESFKKGVFTEAEEFAGTHILH
jgi:hypothetical protein